MLLFLLRPMPILIQPNSWRVYNVSLIYPAKPKIGKKQVALSATLAKIHPRDPIVKQKYSAKEIQNQSKKITKKHLSYSHISPHKKAVQKTEKLVKTKSAMHKVMQTTTSGNRLKNNTKFTGTPQETNQINTSEKPKAISKNSYPSIFNWISSHKFYPISAIYKEEEGRVNLSFYIKKDGTITHINTIKKSYEELNKAALKILKSSSPIPADILKSARIKLPAYVVLAVTFKLEDN
ncbi:energy transducer TonB [Hippea maritima]|uniref:energy transducer TonB n=1 Tax=Hippea maritima TaxID=84405 RepID=UPI0002E401DC|nr:TonB family protein [Hippea maritima]